MSLSFCDTLIRSVGVRHHGQNFVLDKGAPLDIYRSYLHSLSSHIHLIKLGWTTWTLIDESEFCDKITLAHNSGIPICLGGTLFEIAYTSGLYDEMLDFLSEKGISHIEVASGFAVDINELPEAIVKAKKRGLTVMVEVGFKDEQKDNALPPTERVVHVKQALDCGASYVVLEAREQGSGFSVFKKNQNANHELLERLYNEVGFDKIVFEAPTRASQIYLVNTLGSDVIMGNIPFDEIPRVETIRRRLHASTYRLGPSFYESR